MANPFGLPHAFDSAEIACNQPPMPAFFPNSASNPNNELPNRAHSAYFKTRLCARFISGLCRKGSSCNFAHSTEELRKPLGNGDRREDHRARTFISERFGLGEEQNLQNYRISNPISPCWKTRICHKWSISGDCPYGDHCTYAHGDAELRKVRGDLDDYLVEKNVFIEASSKHTSKLADCVLSKMSKTELAMTNSTHESRKKIRYLTMRNSRIYGDWIDEVV